MPLFAGQAASVVDHARQIEEMGHKVRELSALRKIQKSINSTLDLDHVLALAMQELKEVLGVEACSVMLLDEQSDELVFRASLGYDAAQTKEIHLGVNEGIAGWVVRTGKPALVPDVRADPRWCPEVDWLTGFVTRSIFAVPLKCKGKVMGVIEALNKVQGTVTGDDLQLLDSISMQVVTAIENARLSSELNKAYRDLKGINVQVSESHNTLRALFDGMTERVCIIDRNLCIKAINRTAAAHAGAEPRALVGKTCREVVCHSSGPCNGCAITQTLSTRQPASDTQHWMARSARSRELEINTIPLENAAGDVDRVIYIAQDITEKRKMEVTLLQSAKLAAVGELAAGITHEIGNPLTAVIGNTQMLLEALELVDPRRHMAQLIERASLRMERVVHDLLDFARQAEYQFAPTNVNTSIEDALSLVAYQFDQGKILATKDFQANLPLIHASASHLQTVWLNLLLNARDAIPKGTPGQIHIATWMDENRQSVHVIFKDNGSGIAAEDLARIFDPFFTTKPHGKGTGLGLYISQAVVVYHHGSIQVESQVGKGSKFVVTLPLDGTAETHDTEGPASATRT